MIEKPLAQDTESSQRLVSAFAAAGLVGAVGHIERYNPALQQARSRIEQGDLGEVYQVVTRRQGPFPARIADVGVVKDLGTHDIDLTAWVTQQSFVSVAARTAYRSGREHEDMVAVVGQLSGGTITNHLVNWLSPLKERVTIITGEKGALVADTLTADLTFFANGQVQTTWDDIANFRGVSEGDVVRYAINKPEPLRVEHEQFRDAVLGKDADIVTLERAWQRFGWPRHALSRLRRRRPSRSDRPVHGSVGERTFRPWGATPRSAGKRRASASGESSRCGQCGEYRSAAGRSRGSQ